jgi:hypothetical protein
VTNFFYILKKNPLKKDPQNPMGEISRGKRLACRTLSLVSTLAAVVPLTWNASARAFATSPDDIMQPVTISGIHLKTAEYWIFEGNVPFRYPDDVIRGFYPREIPERTLVCAEQAFAQARDYLTSSPLELQQAVELGVTRTMVLLINDYTLAAVDRVNRGPKVSHWGWGERDLAQGYWRWEITLSKSGSCQLPRMSQVRETFRQAKRSLVENLRQVPRQSLSFFERTSVR